MLILPIGLLIALAIKQIWEIRHKLLRKLSVSLVLAGYLWGLFFFYFQFFIQMPVFWPWERNADFEIAATEISQIEKGFENVIVSNDLRGMYIYLWLKGLVKLEDIRNQPEARYSYKYQLGKFIFNRGNCDFSEANNKSLLVGQPYCLKETDELYRIKTGSYKMDSGVFALYQLATATQSAKTKIGFLSAFFFFKIY
jgi:hypothetical protein